MKRIILLLILMAGAGVGNRAAAQIFSVRANALAALSGTLHVGAEVAPTDNWSVETSLYWNPIRGQRLTTRMLGVQVGSRYWLYESFVGHFIGQQVSYVDYQIGNRRRRYDGRAYGFGVSYGYSWMLSTRWNVVVEAGVGIYRTRDVRRDPTASDWQTEYVYHARRWTLAPSKIEVSFNYIF